MTTSKYPLLDCDQCGRPTRDKRDTIKTAPQTLMRVGTKCVTCYKKPHIPESEIAHARNGLNAWLEDRRKRLGVTA
jgi:hypothetical protein